MERNRGLLAKTVDFVSSLWDREDRPTTLEATPVSDVEDQVRFVVNGNEHQQTLHKDSENPKAP